MGYLYQTTVEDPHDRALICQAARELGYKNVCTEPSKVLILTDEPAVRHNEREDSDYGKIVPMEL